MKERKKIFSFSLILCIMIEIMHPYQTQAATQVNYQNIIQEESTYLASLQLDNGCYPMTAFGESTDGRVQMSPYFAEFTALALLESGQTYLPSVKKYLDWHFSHLNTKEEDFNGEAGTIYDYWEYVDRDKNHVNKEIVFMQDGEKSKKTRILLMSG